MRALLVELRMFAGMAMFGADSLLWTQWQSELVGTIGTVAGLAGAATGLWAAIRSEHRAFK
jgi:hypothetical protein